ncbi:AmmeMemoRadiSam system radical SAM enzyme [Candidatus Aerophobetes bacterium]|uniref:AmmeMemoRadiSam system radical SAM enzyme n=1 Tax=Aerophobetes bacterium TaxID=2030807 RepID=A0A523ZG75_UNCAE|nr:MAG: AmmeMemoRadiSam system radical SAM enzyme [Candidatus Aerophobetes bacterium]
MQEAMFYKKLENKRVECKLCAHSCQISNDRRGVCRVRENREGVLYSLVYGKAISSSIDPIEKKPLYHFYPGSNAFSVATVGCNFRCLNCQNHSISQLPGERREIPGEELSPQSIVFEAKRYDCEIIAYTYTEPTIFFEYAYDTSKLAQKEGIKNVFVTNGYISQEALIKISPYLDAANVDLKSFREDFYKKVCGAELEPVLKTLKLMKKLGIWLEITTLIIPTLNDSDEELKEIAGFIVALGEETPWHLSRFYPTYKSKKLPPTSLETIHRGRQIGLKAGLRYVYAGNVPGDKAENTYCNHCNRLLIRRYGYQIKESNLAEDRCKYCRAKIDGVRMRR